MEELSIKPGSSIFLLFSFFVYLSRTQSLSSFTYALYRCPFERIWEILIKTWISVVALTHALN